MSDPHAQLSQSLPQLTLRVGTCLPASLVHLVGCERSTRGKQLVRRRDGGYRWQRILWHRLDTNTAVRQRSAEPIPRTRLPSTPGRVSIASAGHWSVSAGGRGGRLLATGPPADQWLQTGQSPHRRRSGTGRE